MMKTNKYITVLLILFLISIPLRAELRFTASASKTTVIESENIQVSFSVNGDGGKFTPPNFGAFKVLQGPSTQQSVQIINGSYSKSQSYTYLLQAPAKKGTYTINSAQIEAGGKQLKSNQLNINVMEMSAAQKAQKAQEQKAEQNMQTEADKIIDKNIFVKVYVDKTSAYVGEPIIVRYKLYRNPQLSLAKLALDKEPVFNGFWIKDLRDSLAHWKEEIVNGSRFLSAEIKNIILIPQQIGKLQTDALEFKTITRLEVQNGKRSNDFFDNFFRNNSYKDFSKVVKSPQITINVSETKKPKPTEYKDLVGQYTIETSIDKNKTKTNEPITLKLTISGSGNLNFFEPLKLNLPTDLESYDPKIKDDIKYTVNGISGSRTIEYLIIPRAVGNFTIPAIELPYFDLKKRDYITLKGKEFEIKVEQGKNDYPIVSGKSNSQNLNKDINYIKTKTGSTGFAKKLYGSGLFWTMLLLPALFIIAIIIWKRRKDEESGNLVGKRNKAASKVAIKRLKTAKLHLEKQNKDAFYEEITKALWGYLSDKFAIPVSDLTKEKVRAKLDEINYLEIDTDELINVIDESEFARFSSMNMADAMPRIYTLASNAIIKLESFVG